MPAETLPRHSATPPDGAALRVLVVDDSHDAADSLAMLLELAGHQVRAAYDGEQGLQLALQWRPDVAFLDIVMPGRNGYELAAALRAQATAPLPLLVALAGHHPEPAAQRDAATVFDLHVTKPVALEVLQRLLARLRVQRRRV